MKQSTPATITRLTNKPKISTDTLRLPPSPMRYGREYLYPAIGMLPGSGRLKRGGPGNTRCALGTRSKGPEPLH
jgi:hypothetical protein